MSKLAIANTLNRANLHLKKGQRTEAEQLFAEVLMLFPKNVKAQQGLKTLNAGRHAANSGNPPQQVINKLISFVQEQNLELAIKQSENLLFHYPKAILVWNILGIASAELGQHVRAINAFEQIITLKPNQATAYFNLGNALKDKGQITQAVEAYTEALEIKPDYFEAFNNLKILLSSHDQAADRRQFNVMKRHQQLLKVNIDNAQKLFNDGMNFMKLDRLDEAIQLFEKSILKWPHDANAHYSLAVALQNQGRLENALDAYTKALNIQPDFAQAYNNMGLVLKQQGKIECAIDAYKKAINIRPNSAISYNNLAVVLEIQGNLADAIDAYKKSLTIQPGYDEAVLNTTTLSIELKNTSLIDQELSEKLMDTDDALYNKPKMHILKAIEAFINSNKNLVQIHLDNYASFDPSLVALLNKKDRRFCDAYYKYLSKLIETYDDCFENSKPSGVIYHFGESHCLSYAHQKIMVGGTDCVVIPKITFGGKAFHFMRKAPDSFKEITKTNFKSIPTGSKAFVSFGEIDCRLDEGLLLAAKKVGKPIHELISNTVKGYFSWFAQQNEKMDHDLYFFNVPARVYNKSLTSEQNMAVAELIEEFNAEMAGYVKEHNFRLIDVHKFTVGADGYSNGKYHLDETHLGPAAISQFESQVN